MLFYEQILYRGLRNLAFLITALMIQNYTICL